MTHPHLPRLPHRLPHVDLRSVRHDALVAAELALAAAVLTGSIAAARTLGRSNEMRTVSLASNPPATAPVGDVAPAATASAEVVPSVAVSVNGTKTTVHVYVPSSGSSRIELIDAANVTVSTLVIGQPTTRIPGLAAGEYRVVVTNEGPVEVVGDAAISSAMSVRSPVIIIGAGDVLTVVQDATS